jgi:hypothetical protein
VALVRLSATGAHPEGAPSYQSGTLFETAVYGGERRADKEHISLRVRRCSMSVS